MKINHDTLILILTYLDTFACLLFWEVNILHFFQTIELFLFDDCVTRMFGLIHVKSSQVLFLNFLLGTTILFKMAAKKKNPIDYVCEEGCKIN